MTQARAAEADAAGLTDVEQQFLAASVERQSALDKEDRHVRRLRWLAAGMTVVGVIAVIATVFAWSERNQAAALYRKAEVENLASTAESLASSLPDQSVLLALEAWRRVPVAKAVD